MYLQQCRTWAESTRVCQGMQWEAEVLREPMLLEDIVRRRQLLCPAVADAMRLSHCDSELRSLQHAQAWTCSIAHQTPVLMLVSPSTSREVVTIRTLSTFTIAGNWSSAG